MRHTPLFVACAAAALIHSCSCGFTACNPPAPVGDRIHRVTALPGDSLSVHTTRGTFRIAERDIVEFTYDDRVGSAPLLRHLPTVINGSMRYTVCCSSREQQHRYFPFRSF